MDKYEGLTLEKFGARASVAVHVLGACGLVNSVLAFWATFKFLNFYENSYYWWTWLMVVVTTGALWIPITVVWPVY